ncbi:MAG: signal peptidase II, partial [Candidatus Gastranaerophilaceae bacterium]
MNIKRLLFFTGNTVIVFFIVLFLKNMILEKLLGHVLVDTNGWISLVYVRNNGAAFNMLAGHTDLLIIFAGIIILFCMLYVLFYKLYISDKFLFLLSAFCAGIFGNAYERYVYNYVTDFIKINFLNFPVFNLYDILITLGALLIVMIIIVDKHREFQENKDAEEDYLYRKF